MRPLGGHEISALLPASGRVMQQRRVWLVCGCVACVVLSDEHNVFADRQDSFGGCGAIRASTHFSMFVRRFYLFLPLLFAPCGACVFRGVLCTTSWGGCRQCAVAFSRLSVSVGGSVRDLRLRSAFVDAPRFPAVSTDF